MTRSFFETNEFNNSLTIFHQNIAGILSKKEIIDITVQELGETGKNIDVMCFSETFIKSGSESNINIDGFKFGSSFSRSNQKRGGVCILCRKPIISQHLQYIKDMSEESTFECCGIDIPAYKCIVICVYRTPRSNPNIFFEKFESLMDKLKYKTRRKIIIAGDLNIDTLKNTNIASELNRIVSNYKFKLHINVPTRKNACLDHIISNIWEATNNIHNVGLSDHNTAQSITFPIDNKTQPIGHWFRYKRVFNSEYTNKFCECLRSLSWFNVLSNSDLNSAFDTFHDTLKLFYDLCFPIQKIRINNKTKHSQWITKGIKKSAITKRKLRFNYYKSVNVVSKKKYLSYSKLLKRCVINAQKLTNAMFIAKSDNICKSTWKLINNNCGPSQHNNIVKTGMDKIVCNNEIINDPIDIANKFNKYLIDLTNNKITNSVNSVNDKQFFDKMKIKTTDSSIFLLPTDDYEVAKIIGFLKMTNSTGYDDIATKILKACKNEIAPILSYLINLSFSSGTFPEALKLSVVKPIYKKGDSNNIDNYRPISLIPTLSKIIEKAMYNRLNDFLNKYNIIKSEQNGFQKGKSTTLAAFTLVNKIIENIDNRKPVTSIFFDMSKAFDFVSHDLLLRKCEAYGIRGVAHNWLKSYLHQRHQYVEIAKLDINHTEKSYKSTTETNSVGVPQGSILGPLLFLIYINDLPDNIEYDCTLFADDISVVIPCQDSGTYNDHINNTVRTIILWLRDNNLKPNLNKTKYIQFVNKNGKKHNINVHFENQIIQECSQTAFLGILLDDRCSWSVHINNICKRLNPFVYALWKLAKITSIDTAIQAYHGYVCSMLRYGIVLWGNSCHIKKAFLAQKQCVRAFCDVDSLTSCRPLFQTHNLLTVPSLYIFEICNFVRSHPCLFTKMSNIGNFNSRHPNKLSLPKMKTALYHRNSYPMAINIYNKLPEDLKKIPLSLFRLKLKKWLVQACFYSVDEYLNR